MNKRILCFALVVFYIFLSTACGETTPPSPPSPIPIVIPDYINTIVEPKREKLKKINPPSPEFKAKLQDASEKNSDTVGWLTVPGTKIDEQIVQYTNNTYYERKNLNKTYDWYGCYFADYENTFGDRNTLSNNTIIYGHSMDDNPNGRKFSEMKKYLNPEFAANNPYIYFGTAEDQMIWEVFAVFYAEAKFPYFHPLNNTADFKYILEQVQDRNEYYFIDTEVTTKDKILTLSTCTYIYGMRTDQRYVVMAKLVPEGTELRERSSIAKNENPKKPQF